MSEDPRDSQACQVAVCPFLTLALPTLLKYFLDSSSHRTTQFPLPYITPNCQLIKLILIQ